MDGDRLARLRAWLQRPEIRALDPERIDRLARSVDAGDEHVAAGRWGTLIGYDAGPPRRRLVQFDRHGHLMAALRWGPGGDLEFARCLTASGQWIGVEPRSASGEWGHGDRVWLLDGDSSWAPREPLTFFAAVDYARVDFIPALAEPRRLPPGAGTAVLDLIAGLMKDQGVARARYRGPYPTEQLFTALLESFRYDPAAGDPLARFLDDGDLDWLPAPHERHRVAPHVTVQLRHEIEKVVLHGAAFYRAEWQSVRRREPRVVRREGDRVVCSLWAFGRPIEDRLKLDASGEVAESPAPAADRLPPSPLPPVWRPALAELIARESAPPLAESIGHVVGALPLEWGGVDGDLLGADGQKVRLSRHLRAAAISRLREVPPGPGRTERAIEVALEVARLLAPIVRLRAQIHLEAQSVEAQQQALVARPDTAPLSASVGRLLSLLASGTA